MRGKAVFASVLIVLCLVAVGLTGFKAVQSWGTTDAIFNLVLSGISIVLAVVSVACLVAIIRRSPKPKVKKGVNKAMSVTPKASEAQDSWYIRIFAPYNRANSYYALTMTVGVILYTRYHTPVEPVIFVAVVNFIAGVSSSVTRKHPPVILDTLIDISRVVIGYLVMTTLQMETWTIYLLIGVLIYGNIDQEWVRSIQAFFFGGWRNPKTVAVGVATILLIIGIVVTVVIFRENILVIALVSFVSTLIGTILVFLNRGSDEEDAQTDSLISALQVVPPPQLPAVPRSHPRFDYNPVEEDDEEDDDEDAEEDPDDFSKLYVFVDSRRVYLSHMCIQYLNNNGIHTYMVLSVDQPGTRQSISTALKLQGIRPTEPMISDLQELAWGLALEVDYGDDVASDSQDEFVGAIAGMTEDAQDDLYEAQIYTFGDLAAISDSLLEFVLAGNNVKYSGTWKQQAALARDGKLSELQAYKKTLEEMPQKPFIPVGAHSSHSLPYANTAVRAIFDAARLTTMSMIAQSQVNDLLAAAKVAKVQEARKLAEYWQAYAEAYTSGGKENAERVRHIRFTLKQENPRRSSPK